jgi:L-histidine N-alpha-methyltransferase
MGGEVKIRVDVCLDDRGAPETMAREIRDGLTSAPKCLPSKYFYDETGSRLFERITELPEYYLTRAEQALLEDRSSEIAQRTRAVELVELGAGSARKTRTLIEAGLEEGSLRRYLLIDVSAEAARNAARAMARSYPGLRVHVLVGDFEKHLVRVPDGGRRVVAFLGSTIGNFTESEAVDLLVKTGLLLERGDWLLLGTDLVKDRETLEAAYNDSAGVTADFNSNILNVINRHLGGDFDTDAFEHVSYYNEEASRIETYLRPTSRQRVRLERIDLDVEFAAGEMMRTEVSCKFTRASVKRILERAGMRLEHWFSDADGAYALSLSQLR